MSDQGLLAALQESLPPGMSVECPLKAGGQGAVFRGECDGEPSVLKVFDPDCDPRRIAREVALLSKMSHSHLVAIRRSVELELRGTSCWLIAYEFLPGGDLRDLANGGENLSTEDVLVTLGVQIGGALEELWKHRIVHRDVKPDNIVRRGVGDYVLVDVGLAMHLDLTGITVAGGAPGTRGYKSPEQARGWKNLTIKSDVFGLGVTLYELATRSHPFGFSQTLVGGVVPRPLHEVNSGISRQMSALVMRMLSVRAADRPSNPSEHFRALM